MLSDLSQCPVDLELWPFLEGLLTQRTLANLRVESPIVEKKGIEHVGKTLARRWQDVKKRGRRRKDRKECKDVEQQTRFT